MCCGAADKGRDGDFERNVKKKRRGARGADAPI